MGPALRHDLGAHRYGRLLTLAAIEPYNAVAVVHECHTSEKPSRWPSCQTRSLSAGTQKSSLPHKDAQGNCAFACPCISSVQVPRTCISSLQVPAPVLACPRVCRSTSLRVLACPRAVLACPCVFGCSRLVNWTLQGPCTVLASSLRRPCIVPATSLHGPGTFLAPSSTIYKRREHRRRRASLA
jgi:hypothetical protein